jgi:chemotaxis protein methyltransferase CheR
MTQVPLTDEEYQLFAEWLAREVGIRFGPERREILRARLEPLRAALDLPTFDRLLFHVRYHPARADARARLLSDLTNNESYFFREGAQLDLFRQEVLPALGRAARAEGRAVRILSAGSAAGEEPYTLAIIARETLSGLGGSAVVTGLDLDTAAIGRAEAGLYRDHAFRGVDDGVRRRYFTPEDGAWRIRPELKAAARFRHGNLMEDEWIGVMDPQDAVFCRNVMIYFDDDGVRRAAEHLYRAVRPGGVLFLGHAESLSRIPTRFVPERRAGAFFYRRPTE